MPLHQKSPVYTYRTELKKAQLRISLFYKNTADYFNELNPRADNKSFSKRRGYERLSRTMYLKVTIYIHVFNQDQLLFNGLSLKNNFLSHFWFRIYSIQCFISSCHFVWKRYNHGKNIWDKLCNHFHNILKLFYVFSNFLFATSEAMCNYYLQTCIYELPHELLNDSRLRILGN